MNSHSINHYAYFDCLAIGYRLDNVLGDFESSEIYLFSYLSCLLSLYDKQPVTNWGYGFAVTKEGFPYSPALVGAINDFVNLGYFTSHNEIFKISHYGKEEYSWQKNLSQNEIRERFIDGACSSLLALPVGTIRFAISQDPELKGAISLSQSRMLFTESGIDSLYEQFAKLSSAISVEVGDLMVPAVVWLTFLSIVNNSDKS